MCNILILIIIKPVPKMTTWRGGSTVMYNSICIGLTTLVLMQGSLNSFKGFVKRVLGVNEGHKSEAVYDKWHLFQSNFMV